MRIKDIIRHTILLFLLLRVAGIESQTHHFKNYNTEQGLPQSQVLSLFQDSKGYMWVGTNSGGVGKFDGNKFQTLTKNDGLIDDVVFSITENDEHELLFGTSKGLSKFDHLNFVNYDERKGLKNTWIYHLLKDGKKFWIGTQQGVYVLENDTILAFNKDTLLNQSSVYSIHKDNIGNLWFGTMQNGIIHYNTNNEKINYLNTGNGMMHNFIFSIEESYEGDILAGTLTGLNIITKDLKIKEASEIKSNGNLSFSSILKTDDNSYLFGTFAEGLLKFNFKKKNDVTFFDLQNGLTNNPILTTLKDREGNIWIGTDGSGLFKYFNDKFTYYTKNNGLAENYINAIAEDHYSNIWVAPSSNGLAKISGNKIESFNQDYFKKNSLPDKNINTILPLKDGRVFFGTDEGLCYYQNNQFITFENPIIRRRYIASLYEHPNGQIYIGTSSGVIQFKDNNFKDIRELDKYMIDGKLGVFFIAQDKNDNLCFGTEYGLVVLNNGKTTLYNADNRFVNARVSCGILDMRKNMWLGTADGLYLYSNGIFTRISKKQGFTSGFINFLELDRQSNILYIGSNNGIDVLNLDSFYVNKSRFKHLGKDDGLISLESNANASDLTKDGKLIVGTIKGVEIFNPKLDISNTNEPLTSITDVKLLYGQEDLSSHSSGIDKLSLLPVNLVLPFSKNNLTFKYIGISLIAPEKVMYQYKLEGLDEDWTPAVSKTEITYPSIPPGTYTFFVKAMNNDGVWNKEPVSFTFEILPPWYKTWWFYSTVVILLVTGFFGYNYFRTKKLIADKQKLEKVVNDRTRELREEKEKVEVINKEVIQQKVEIENKNTEITDSIRYAKNIQEALLPSLKETEQVLGNAFILYLPKDIVSGDFYWHSFHNGIHYLAAADCTGHGVPGAFMSIVGNNLLNEIINSKNYTKPGDILFELHQGVKVALNQHEQESQRRDGMDIALCAIDTNRKTIEYAGANRPFWLFRKENNYGIEIIKPSKFPIGGIELEERRVYENHLIHYKQGDTLYIFSDGFADQFGGPRGKKFMVANMQKLLKENVGLPLSVQKENIASVFHEWKNNLEQIDDVLVIGMRL